MNIFLGIDGKPTLTRVSALVKILAHDGNVIHAVNVNEGLDITQLTALGVARVYSDDTFAADHAGTDHIASARWADVFLVVDASADFCARYAHGYAGDFLCLQLLAATCPVVVAPRIPEAVWSHPAVAANVKTLSARGVRVAPNAATNEQIAALVTP